MVCEYLEIVVDYKRKTLFDDFFIIFDASFSKKMLFAKAFFRLHRVTGKRWYPCKKVKLGQQKQGASLCPKK
jgi:hypothetical protein